MLGDIYTDMFGHLYIDLGEVRENNHTLAIYVGPKTDARILFGRPTDYKATKKLGNLVDILSKVKYDNKS